MQPIKQYSVVKILHSSERSGKQDDVQDEQDIHPERVECHDLVVTEEPLEIWLSAHPTAASKLLFTTMRTPGDDINLVRGWLYSSGAVQDSKKVLSITHSGTGRLKSMPTNRVQVNLAAGADIEMAAYQRVEVMNSACGVCGQQSIESLLDKLPQAVMTHSQTSWLGVADIASLTQQLRGKQPIFNQTGGIHGVALFDQRLQILDVREDVGRHNAFDKLIGANLPLLEAEYRLEKTSLGVVLTSRASFELIQKAAMVNIRYVIAMGAPSSLAIDLAKDCDICLIGFVKKVGVSIEFNVYSNSHMLI